MLYLLGVLAWLAVGAAVGLIEARHGAWHRGWVLMAPLGPLAIPLAVDRRRQAKPEPAVLATGQARRGPVDLLVGLDGSPASSSAASLALQLFGPRVHRVTLATVLDLDTAGPHAPERDDPEPWPEEQSARARLASMADSLRTSFGCEPGMVILAGEPADALERYAIDEGYEVIVIGSRGTGLGKRLFGSCASELACRTKVPVLVIPASPVVSAPDDVRRSAGVAHR